MLCILIGCFSFEVSRKNPFGIMKIIFTGGMLMETIKFISTVGSNSVCGVFEARENEGFKVRLQ